MQLLETGVVTCAAYGEPPVNLLARRMLPASGRRLPPNSIRRDQRKKGRSTLCVATLGGYIHHQHHLQHAACRQPVHFLMTVVALVLMHRRRMPTLPFSVEKSKGWPSMSVAFRLCRDWAPCGTEGWFPIFFRWQAASFVRQRGWRGAERQEVMLQLELKQVGTIVT